MRKVLPILCVLQLAACTVGPNYEPPKLATPAAFAEPAPPAANVDLARWWTVFGDEELNHLVTVALAENLDMKAAASRVRQARLGVTAARSALFPQINSSADANRVNFSKNAGLSSLASLFGGGGGAPSTSSQGIAGPGDGITTYSAGFDASWEIDIFGGTRRAIEGAKARTEAAEWSQRDAAVSLIAEVADTYLQLRVLQRREAIARDEIRRQQRTVDLTTHIAQVGLTPQSDTTRQRSQLATSQAAIGPIVAEQHIQMHALAVLLGRAPEDMMTELAVERPSMVPIVAVPPGLPADLLRRRPDVRAAERQLAAATADIGVAVADLYPRLTLTGMAEFISTSLANLFTGNSLQWTAAAQATFPVLDFGRRHAQVGIRKEQAQQAYLDYQKTVLGALKDVDDALIRFATERDRNAILRKGLENAQRSAAAVTARYQSGLVDFSAVLAAQAAVLSSRDASANSDGALQTDLASLYKALGGGWSD